MTDDPDVLRRQAADLMAQANALDLSQLGQADIEGMSPQKIEEAREAGRLQVLLGADPAEVALTQRAKHDRLTPGDVKALYAAGHHQLIADAQTDGRIDYPNQKD